jgi:Ras-related protein Rab-5C
MEFSMVIFFQLINWQKQVEAYARENGCIFLETSAKTGHNVVEIFTEIAKKLPQQSWKNN